jgi:putative ABC transport system permease protein
MLLITVSGVSLGLASQTAVQSDDVDYWVVPEGGNLDTIAVSTDGPRLGSTHQVADRLTADARIAYATPVLLQVVPVDSPDGSQFILFVGVVAPADRDPRIAGIPTASLTPGDPYYNHGAYNGTWTGEMVLNPAAAELLNRSAGERLSPRSAEANFSVVAVSDEEFTTGIGTTPIALVQLSELQAVTGTKTADSADQMLVSTNDAGVEARLEGVYPNGVVVSRTGIATQQTSVSSLPLAMGVAAFVIALVIGVLFTATMMGLEITNDRRILGTLAAIGYSPGSVTLLVLTETVSLALLGGLLGAGLGAASLVIINQIVADVLAVPAFAVIEPVLFVYGIGTALLIGVLAAPYPMWLSRRSDVLSVIRR